jgi:hypothetical protein
LDYLQIEKLIHACLAVRRNQRFLVIAVLVGGSSELLPAFQNLTPHQMDGDYIGLQSMPNISPDEKDAKWFHENKLLVRDKQVILDMSPVYYQRGKKWHSASDGGFMTYRGVFFRKDGEDFVRLRLFQSDYVSFPVGHKPYEELHVYPVKFSPRSNRNQQRAIQKN